MAQHSRFRERTLKYAAGGSLTSDGVIKLSKTGFAGRSAHETCSDQVNTTKPYKDGALNIHQYTQWSPLYLYGSFYSGSTFGTVTMSQYGDGPGTGSDWLSVGSLPTIPWDANYYLTKGIANMNPQKPVTDLPLFLFELKDLPRMLMDIGRFAAAAKSTGTWGDVLRGAYGDKVVAKDIPGTFLSYRFGWAPLVSDIVNLFKLTKLVDDRFRYFRNLESGHGLKRRLFFGRVHDSLNRSSSYGYRLPWYGSQYAYTADVRERMDMEVWFTAHAALVDPIPQSETALRALSKKTVLGLTHRPRFYWDAIPFSWLIDYFINVGDIIEARQGLINLKISRFNLMHRVKYARSHENVWVRDGITYTPYRGTYVAKHRLAYANPSPFLTSRPIWNGPMYATIGALALSTALGGRSAVWRR